MKTGNRANILLVELLIVVLFFMLGSTVLVRVFGEAYLESRRAGYITEATAEAQNTADLIMTSEDPGEALRELGYEPSSEASDATGNYDEIWIRENENYSLKVGILRETAETGTMIRAEIEAYGNDGTEYISLPAVRYMEG